MTLIKYNNPAVRFRTPSVSRIFDDLFNDNFFNNSNEADKAFVPKVDVSETDNAFELSFAVPGIDKKNINVDINEGVLTVNGEREFKNDKKEKNFHSVETSFGSFKRSFHLPDNIDADKVQANYKDGILDIVVPKDEKKIQKKTISVN
ncbi:Hsp20/alpha crystallin family protein [Reichenbachiella versicolor]|uniref:Hsp20/alpha crystallin family protein n=1 Tax=Reichenbachiella versicolor TaxID=1821036 RepID=UPI000D6DFA09|nr:Hsp20/alpha crystallin family protein [Reichenbachiella versicolor]